MRLLFALLVVVTLTSSADAETKIGFRQLGVISPVVVQHGTKSQVRLHSNFTLDGTYAVFFDRPGIRMSYAETKPIAAPRRGRGRLGTPFPFDVTVPADQPTGLYEVRVATHTAVSSVSHLLVTEYPVVPEATGENGTPQTAQSVTFPAAIAGTCNPTADVDDYRFSGKAGQELTIQIYAQRVTQAVHSMQCGNKVYLMDPMLTLFGPRGRVIAQNDNFIGGDSLITCRLPETADYVLEVRDARYVGNQKYVYCVEISDRPFVHTTFPMAVQRGTTAKLELIGHALGGTKTVLLPVAPDAKPGTQTVRVATTRGETNRVAVTVSPHRQVVVTGTHNSTATAIPVTLPVGINGRFPQPGQIHFVSFEAHKGRYYHFEATANRRGLPLDPVIEIYNSRGRIIATADDGLQTKDPNYYFRAPADGQYYCSIRDLGDSGGERFCYHLSIEPSGEDFEVHGEYYYAQIAPGTRMIWFARVNRLNGFTGPVEMQIDGLPQGVSFTPVTIPAGMTDCGLILSAARDAKINASLVRVRGKATVRGPDGQNHEIVRDGRITCELQSQGGGQARWPIHTQIVGVTGPLDLLHVEASPREITLPPNGRATINVRIVRNKGFKNPVTLATAFKYFTTTFGRQLPPGVTLSKASTARLSGKILEGKLILEAGPRPLPVTRLPIAAVARVSITFSITTNYASNPVYLTIPAMKKK